MLGCSGKRLAAWLCPCSRLGWQRFTCTDNGRGGSCCLASPMLARSHRNSCACVVCSLLMLVSLSFVLHGLAVATLGFAAISYLEWSPTRPAEMVWGLRCIPHYSWAGTRIVARALWDIVSAPHTRRCRSSLAQSQGYLLECAVCRMLQAGLVWPYVDYGFMWLIVKALRPIGCVAAAAVSPLAQCCRPRTSGATGTKRRRGGRRGRGGHRGQGSQASCQACSR